MIEIYYNDKYLSIDSNNLFFYKKKLFTGKIIYYNGYTLIKNGVLHSLSEASNVFTDENGKIINQHWYYNGKKIYCKSNEEFFKIIKLLIFK